MKSLLLRGYGEIPIKINPIGEQDAKWQYCYTWADIPLYVYPSTPRNAHRLFYSGGKEKISKKMMINGELVIEWKKEKMHKGCSCGEYLL